MTADRGSSSMGGDWQWRIDHGKEKMKTKKNQSKQRLERGVSKSNRGRKGRGSWHG